MLQRFVRRSISVFAAAAVGFALAPAGFAPVFATGTADLWVGLGGPSTATTGTAFTYTNAFGSYGPDTATGVRLTNTYSYAVTINTATSDASCFQTSSTVITCGPFSSYVNAPARIHLTVSTTSAGTLVDTLTGTANQSDPNPANNTATSSTTVSKPTTADIFVAKNVGAGPYYVGQTFDYFVSVGNSGPADATNVIITDQLPSQVQFVAAEAPCTASGNLVTCQFGTIWSHAVTDGYRITVRALTAGSVTNTATGSADQPDPNTANNSSSVTIQIQPRTADVAVTKTGTPNPVVAGQKETYTITVTNYGPLTATGVVAQDAWSAAGIKGGIAFKSVATTQGTCTQSGAAISCTLGNLASGGTATITLVLQPRSKGTLSDTATATANEYDPNPANNSASVTTTVG